MKKLPFIYNIILYFEVVNSERINIMYFFKTNYSMILKTIVFQIILSWFGMMLFVATSESPALAVIGSVLAIGSYFFIMYDQFWAIGAKNAIKKQSYTLQAFIAAVLAYLPAMILVVILLISPAYDATGEATGSFVFFSVLKSMFMGIFSSLMKVMNVALKDQNLYFAFATLMGIFSCFFGYVMGNKEIKITALMGFKTKTK